jgi:membrane protein DedA with SNARE-associated domain
LENLVFELQSGQLPELGNWTYFFLILLVILEGPTATLLGAAAASAGLLKPSGVLLAATIGNLTADCLWYSIGYLGKPEWLSRFQRFGLRPRLIEYLKRNMTTHVVKILVLAKFSLSFMIPTLITAGLLRIPWRRWFPTLIFADTVWTGLLVVIGYYSLESMKGLKQGIEYAMLFVSLVLVAGLFILGQRLKKQWDLAAADPDPSSEQA